MTLTDVGEGVGHIVESERAVDVDATSPAMHSSASGSKWAGPSFTASTPSRRPVSRPAIQPIVSTRSSADTDPPTQR